MSDAIRNFIEANVPKAGLVAWGARFADCTFGSQCYNNWFTSAQVEQTLNRLATAAKNLGQYDIEPMRLCWTFEHALIYMAFRADSVCVALFVENRPDLPRDAFERALDEFLAQGKP